MFLLSSRSIARLNRSLRRETSVRRLLSTSSGGPAFVFDIDGVLKQGSHVLPAALKALRVLNGENHLRKRWTTVLCTNGGGSMELARSQRLTRELQIPIGEHQIVQSHTIFRSMVPKYADKPILVVGGIGDNCRQIAEAYGFKHAYTPADVMRWRPSVWPYHKLTEEELAYSRDVDFSTIPFAAVLIFHDSRDWGRDVQLVLDLVRAKDGVFGTLKDEKDVEAWKAENQLPVHFSQPDLLWGNEFPQARFGQGALQESMAAVYKFTTGHELQRTTGGKPTRATYEYASSLLLSQIENAQNGTPINLHSTRQLSDSDYQGRVYMIGDNPLSDIAGANAFGWESILLKTGVFRGTKKEEATHVPTVLKEDVWEGVKWALEREGEGAAIEGM